MLEEYRSYVLTITADNVSKLCGYEVVTEKFKAGIFFNNAYSSWERGLTDNFNGLFCQYIRKAA